MDMAWGDGSVRAWLRRSRGGGAWDEIEVESGIVAARERCQPRRVCSRLGFCAVLLGARNGCWERS